MNSHLQAGIQRTLNAFPSLRRAKNSLYVCKYYNFQSVVRMRSELELDQVERLSEDVALATREYFSSNCWYGNNLAINACIGAPLNAPVRGIIEHGLYLGRKKFSGERRVNGFHRVYTYSDYRRSVLLEQGYHAADIVVCGPYIQYVRGLLSTERMRAMRQRLGRALVVFPSHSTSGIDVNYDVAELIRRVEVEKTENGFDTAVFCVFYRDVQRGLHTAYQRAGYHVVTAGHKFDPNFLPRLRSIFEIAHSTVSNSIGTHIGYSVALGRPHRILSQETTWDVRDAIELEGIDDEMRHNLALEKRILMEAFGSHSVSISPEQRSVVSHFWGPIQCDASIDIRGKEVDEGLDGGRQS